MSAVITIDVVDAIEAAELVSFVETWLAHAGGAVAQDFAGFAAPLASAGVMTQSTETARTS